MKKYYFLIIVALILGLVLTGCLLSNVGQVPTNEQSGIAYLTKGILVPGNLVGLWHFNEGSGTTANDSSGNGNTGTLTNMDTATCWVDGKFGKALNFNGSDDYVDCGTVPQLNGVGEFTVEFWIWVDILPFPTNEWQGIIARGNQHQRTPWVFGNKGESNLYIQFETTTGASDCSLITNDLTAGQWNHVAFTWDGHTVTSYLDGVAGPTDTTTGSVLADPDASLKFGYIPNYAYFDGLIDEVRIWNTALTANQIQQSMASPLPVIVTTSRSGGEEVEVNAEQDWGITITVCNYDAFKDLNGVVVQDGMGADLDEISKVGEASGDVAIGPKTVGQGNQKMRATMVTWTLELYAGSCETLMVKVTTGWNAKALKITNPEDRPGKWHEFTEVEDDHELDGGASATYWYESMEYKTPETEPLTVDVVMEM